MLPEITLLVLIGIVIILAQQEQRGGIRKYVIIVTIALLQTVLVVLEMYIMKVPKL